MAASLQPFFLRLRHDSNIKEAEEGGSSDLFDDSPKTVVDFEEKERVLCYHGPLLYEAKILKIKLSDDDSGIRSSRSYLVHYNGWKDKYRDEPLLVGQITLFRRWDEWVPPERLVKHDQVGLEQQRHLQLLHASGGKQKTTPKLKREKKIDDSNSEKKKSEELDDLSIENSDDDKEKDILSLEEPFKVAEKQLLSGKRTRAAAISANAALNATFSPPKALKSKRLKTRREKKSLIPSNNTESDPIMKKIKLSSPRRETVKKSLHNATKTATQLILETSWSPEDDKGKDDPIISSPVLNLKSKKNPIKKTRKPSHSTKQKKTANEDEIFRKSSEKKNSSKKTAKNEDLSSLEIPASLLGHLHDDWLAITKRNMIPIIPAETSVTTILKDFAKYRRTRSSTEQHLDEFVAGLKGYFEFALGRCLLYRLERHHLLSLYKDEEFGKKAPSMCDSYGAIHLLRLFGTLAALVDSFICIYIVKLPAILDSKHLGGEALAGLRIVHREFSHLLEYLEANSALFFGDIDNPLLYMPVGSAYLEATRNG